MGGHNILRVSPHHMNNAVATTLSLFLLIILGFTLRSKFSTDREKEGIKILILSVALPAMIFVGLQKVEFTIDVLAFPVCALVFNWLAFYFTDVIAILFRLSKNDPARRTMKMLIPSLAPGLTCFPFLLEYFGEATMANAAIADVGNKVFVLIILYLLALSLYQSTLDSQKITETSRIKSLVKSLFYEPVNVVIIVGIAMISMDLRYEQFPQFLQMTIDYTSMIMTPLVLMYIGLSVKLNWKQIKTIWSALLMRSAFAFMCSAALLMVLKVDDPLLAVLIVLFPQSSCSFWPYAHMHVMNKLSAENGGKEPIFDIDLAMNIMAFSLPLSTVIILSLSTYGVKIANPALVFKLGLVLFLVTLVPAAVAWLFKGGVDRRATSD